MKKIITLGVLLYSLAAVAQDSTSSKPQFKLSANFNSNLNYFGRTDSLKSTGFFPLAELWITPKFYINAAPIFVNNALQRMDYAGTVATAGYQNITDKWLSHIYLTKPFYEQSARLVQSALKAQTGVTVSRLNKVANITLGADVKFSDNVDFGATAGLDHIIRIENKDGSVLVFDPGLYAYAGTQHFSRTYTRRKSDFLLFPGNNEQVTENVQGFAVLAYEATMPVVFAKDKWQLIATPSFIVPQNLITVAGRPDLSETGKNTFYTTLALKYAF